MINPFQWKNGKAMTPEEVDRARQLADAALGRAGDTSPVGHWTQGAARVIDTLGGVLKDKRASKAEKAGLAGADEYIKGNSVLSALLGGGSSYGGSSGGGYSGGSGTPFISATPQPAGPNMGTDVSPEEMAAIEAKSMGSWNGGSVDAMKPEAFSTFGLGQGPDTQYGMGSATTPTMALDVIKGFEGYRDTPYWDVNAYRTGYGSDTVTMADGSVIPVKQGMRITREDAERDLARRVTTEFMPIAASAVGPEAFAALSEPQQAALTSIAYNYGEIPDSVARAVSSGSPQAAAAAIAALASHNDGINAGRRQQESAMFLSGDGAMAGGYTAPTGGGYTGGGMSSGGSPIPMGGGGAGAVSAIAAAMSDPWVAKKYGPVLNALMGQEMKRGDMQYEAQLRQSDPMYQAQLKAAEAALQPAPMKPIEVGGVLLDPVTYQPIFDSRSADPGFAMLPPDEVAALGLPPGAYQRGGDGKIMQVGGGGTNINVNTGGSPDLGKLSTDYGYLTNPDGSIKRDPATGLAISAPVPGSPAALAAEDAARAGERAAGNADMASDGVLNAATRAREAAKERAVGGLLGKAAAMNPESQNAEVYRQVDVLKSNAKISNLQAMRDASKTGGALGAVTAPELKMLEDKSGALDPASPYFERDLADYTLTLLKTIHGPEAGQMIFDQQYAKMTPPTGADAGPPPAGIGAAEWNAMTPEERALWSN